MKRRYSLSDAVSAARVVRRRLLRTKAWRGTDLTGACGLASILLSIELNDVSILEHGKIGSWPHDGSHVWNKVGKTIIDITASQFTDFDDPPRGILVTTFPREYHLGLNKTGIDAYLYVIDGWYSKSDHYQWPSISEHFL